MGKTPFYPFMPMIVIQSVRTSSENEADFLHALQTNFLSSLCKIITYVEERQVKAN
jgi:hypothetical protein